MYSEIVNDSGISQHTMEMIVLGGIGIFVLGLVFFLWWKQIMIGSLALVAVVVLANHKVTPKPIKVEQEQIIIEKPVGGLTEGVEEPIQNKEEVMTKPKDDKNLFIEDCLQFTDYTKAECEGIWSKREQPALLDVDNVEYKQRRAEAIKKPGAVVMQYTLR
jgi:hypothetical protein